MLLLAAYVILFPPLFVLAPLAGLLAASRPTTLREWAWIGSGGLWLALSVAQPGGIATDAMHAWALFLTGGFVVLMLPGRRQLVPAAILTAVFSLGAVSAWIWLLGTRWRDLQLAVARTGWEACRQLIESAQVAPERLAAVRMYVDAMGDAVAVMADLLPGLLVLAALPGLALAWAWYHRLAAVPVGVAPGRFANFRFSDHHIWLVVACLAAFMLPLPPPLANGIGNLAVATAGLYAARGAAVAWSGLEEFPGLILGLMAVGVLFILPVALGGFFALGVADTWVDFRRRYAANARGE